MDPAAAAAAGNRVTRMSLSRAGRSSWRTWAGATPLRGLNDYASTGSGPTRQSDARDSEPLLVSVDVARAGYCFDYPFLLFNLRSTVVTVRERWF